MMCVFSFCISECAAMPHKFIISSPCGFTILLWHASTIHFFGGFSLSLCIFCGIIFILLNVMFLVSEWVRLRILKLLMSRDTVQYSMRNAHCTLGICIAVNFHAICTIRCSVFTKSYHIYLSYSLFFSRRVFLLHFWSVFLHNQLYCCAIVWLWLNICCGRVYVWFLFCSSHFPLVRSSLAQWPHLPHFSCIKLIII